MKKVLYILFLPFFLFAQEDISNKCSEFIGGKHGVNAFYFQLCYDSTFYFHEWHASGIELIDEGKWWFNREDETVVLNSLELPYTSYAYYDSKKTKDYLYDSIPFKLKDGTLYLFEEDWDTIPLHLKPKYAERMLYYITPLAIDTAEVRYQEKIDSIRRLGPFQKSPAYVYLFLTKDKGFLGIKNRRLERKAARAINKRQKLADRQAIKDDKASAKDKAYIAEKEYDILEEEPKKKRRGRSKKKDPRLEYIQQINAEQDRKRNRGGYKN